MCSLTGRLVGFDSLICLAIFPMHYSSIEPVEHCMGQGFFYLGPVMICTVPNNSAGYEFFIDFFFDIKEFVNCIFIV